MTRRPCGLDARGQVVPRIPTRSLTRRAFLRWSALALVGLGLARRPAGAQTPTTSPGIAAPPAVVQEIQATLARAIERFQARDVEGVMRYVSDEYWTAPLTKPTLRAQLQAIFQIHSQVRAQVRLDDVRLVAGHAWLYTTGQVSGQLALVNQWITLFSWEREIEVARREPEGWRLYGYQQ